jgi:hypothetical protein
MNYKGEVPENGDRANFARPGRLTSNLPKCGLFRRRACIHADMLLATG